MSRKLRVSAKAVVQSTRSRRARAKHEDARNDRGCDGGCHPILRPPLLASCGADPRDSNSSASIAPTFQVSHH
jgi:hypothetical protein